MIEGVSKIDSPYQRLMAIQYFGKQFILLMLIGRQQQSVQEWKQTLDSYERSKRTKRPFGKATPAVERNLRAEMLQREMRFNPVLQSFRDQRQTSRTIEHEEIEKANKQIRHLKNNYRYNVDYDIINFAPAVALPARLKSPPLPPDRKKECKEPTYYSFNIIDGSTYDEEYLKNRSLKRQKPCQRKIHADTRAYNIINGSYAQGMGLGQEQTLDSASPRRSAVSQQYDPLRNRYCNPEEEEDYRKQLKQAQDPTYPTNRKLPPAYLNREALSLDCPAAPNATVQNLETRKEKAKERYKLRYIVEDEHRARGRFEAELREIAAKNRVHEGRIEQQKAREFNILNSNLYEPNRAEKLFGKEITARVYDLRPYASTQKNRSAIKQSGFSKRQQ